MRRASEWVVPSQSFHVAVREARAWESELSRAPSSSQPSVRRTWSISAAVCPPAPARAMARATAMLVGEKTAFFAGSCRLGSARSRP